MFKIPFLERYRNREDTPHAGRKRELEAAAIALLVSIAAAMALSYLINQSDRPPSEVQYETNDDG